MATVTVYICCGEDFNGNLHCALVLKGDFYLSWGLSCSRCKAVLLHRLASGVKVCGLDEVRQARKVLREYHQDRADPAAGFGNFFVCQPVGEVSLSDPSRLERLAERINSDLGNGTCISLLDFGRGSTSCVVFPFMAAAALGIPVSKLVSQAVRIVEGGYRTTGPIIEELDDPPVPEARKQPPVIVEYHSDGEDDSPPSRNTARRDGAKRGSRGQVSSEGAKVAAGAAPCERQPMLARKQSGKTSGGGAGNAGLSGAATTVDARSGVAAHRETGASHNYSMKGAQAR
ncbi:hypothetical protein N2152v2_000089 [Parachlorella kessleri]